MKVIVSKLLYYAQRLLLKTVGEFEAAILSLVKMLPIY